MKIELRLFVYLRQYLPKPNDGKKAVVKVPAKMTVIGLMKKLGIPPETVPLVLINGVQEPNRERQLEEGMVVSLFPPVAGG